jgi:hypothetical protein
MKINQRMHAHTFSVVHPTNTLHNPLFSLFIAARAYCVAVVKAEPKGLVLGRTDDFIERFLVPVLIYQKEDG